MFANVFVLLLIVLAVCRDEVQQFTNEPDCDAIGGVCIPMNNCQNISYIEAVSCPMQFDDGAVCCYPNKIVDSRKHNHGCHRTFSHQYTVCSQSCNRKYNRQQAWYCIGNICIPATLLNFRRLRNQTRGF